MENGKPPKILDTRLCIYSKFCKEEKKCLILPLHLKFFSEKQIPKKTNY